MEIDRGLVGASVVDGSGGRIGDAAGVLVDPSTLHVGWLLVTLSMDGSAAVLPSAAASADAEGRLVVPFDAMTVAGAPKMTGQAITSELAASLLRYYGLQA